LVAGPTYYFGCSLVAIYPKSYAMDALLQYGGKEYDVEPGKVDEFMDKVKSADSRSFESVGYGRDFRLAGKGVIGSSLVWEDAVIHMACFKMEGESPAGSKDTGNMSGYRRRMDNMIY